MGAYWYKVKSIGNVYYEGEDSALANAKARELVTHWGSATIRIEENKAPKPKRVTKPKPRKPRR